MIQEGKDQRLSLSNMYWFHILVGQSKEIYLRFGMCWCAMWKAAGCSKEAESCSWLASKSACCKLQWVWPIGSSFRVVGIQDLSIQPQEGNGTCSDVRTEFMVTTASVVKHWLEISSVSSQRFCVWQMLQRRQHQFHVLGYPARQTLSQLITVHKVFCSTTGWYGWYMILLLFKSIVPLPLSSIVQHRSAVDCWKFLCLRIWQSFSVWGGQCVSSHFTMPCLLSSCVRGDEFARCTYSSQRHEQERVWCIVSILQRPGQWI